MTGRASEAQPRTSGRAPSRSLPVDPCRTGDVTVVGTVRSPKHEREPAGQGVNRHVLSFTLLAYDDRGTVSALSVLMTGWGVAGVDPSDGDRVEVTGSIDKHGVLVAQRITNLDTRAATVVGGGSTKVGFWIMGLLALVIIGSVAAVVVHSALSSRVTVTVPQIPAGMSAETAMGLVDQAGLSWVPQPTANSHIRPNHVIRVSPVPGTKVSKGSKVYLYISTGPS